MERAAYCDGRSPCGAGSGECSEGRANQVLMSA